MKRILAMLLVLLSCLMWLSACAANDPPVTEDTSPPTEDSQTPDQETPNTPAPEDTAPEPIFIDRLTFECVVSWEESSRLLAEMNSLSGLLRDALSAQNCQVDDVTITISTAAGLTGDALENGGVDLAFMPAADYVACNETVSAILTDDKELCTTVLAVSGSNADLSDMFHSSLLKALLETDSGKAFLAAYNENMIFIPATEEAIQAVRDDVAARETGTHGGT